MARREDEEASGGTAWDDGWAEWAEWLDEDDEEYEGVTLRNGGRVDELGVGGWVL